MSDVRLNQPPLYNAQMGKIKNGINTANTVVKAGLLTGAVIGADKFIKHGVKNPEHIITGNAVNYAKQGIDYIKTKALTPAKEYLTKNAFEPAKEYLKVAVKGSESRNVLAFIKKQASKATKLFKGLNPKIKIALAAGLALIGVSHLKNKGKIEGEQNTIAVATNGVQQMQQEYHDYINFQNSVHQQENMTNIDTINAFLKSNVPNTSTNN